MAVDANVETRASGWKPEPFVGRTFDGYRVEEAIGQGGMGAVFKATQLSLNRPVALKLLAQNLASDDQFLERFHREAAVLSRLAHPNIVTVIDRGEVDGRPYLVMEYIEGTNLRQVMQDGPLPSGEALKVVSSILAALEHAHGQGIVHRDIKPENVLLAQGGIVKVADFGLSRLLGPEDTTRLTRTNIALGTYEYMAPEQREKARDADERCDLYAAGVVLYEMLTAELPIGRFALPSRRRPDECDARIDRIIEKSLEKDPEERYQSAQSMGDAVSQVLDRPSETEAPAPARGTGEIPSSLSPVRFEHHIGNVAAIDRLLGNLLYVVGFAWFVWAVFEIRHLAATYPDIGFALLLFVFLGCLWFLGGWWFRWTGKALRKHNPAAPASQAVLCFIAALTVLLIPFAVYGLWVLYGHRGRLYYEARARGLSPDAAASECHGLLEGRGAEAQGQ